MGAARVTTQNLEVVKTDADRGLVFIKGAVPRLQRWLGHRERRREEEAARERPVPGRSEIGCNRSTG